MMFVDIMKQSGVGSVGTLYRECLERVAFCHEGFNSDECYNQYHNFSKYICVASYAGFWPVSANRIILRYNQPQLERDTPAKCKNACHMRAQPKSNFA